jgi:hypothetical protein
MAYIQDLEDAIAELVWLYMDVQSYDNYHSVLDMIGGADKTPAWNASVKAYANVLARLR